jgi:hypothetical protein
MMRKGIPVKPKTMKLCAVRHRSRRAHSSASKKAVAEYGGAATAAAAPAIAFPRQELMEIIHGTAAIMGLLTPDLLAAAKTMVAVLNAAETKLPTDLPHNDIIYCATVLNISQALLALNTYGNLVCPRKLLAQCAQHSIAELHILQFVDHRYLTPANSGAHVLYSASRRAELGTRQGFLESIVNDAARTPVMVRMFFQDHTNELSRVADDLNLLTGTVGPPCVGDQASEPFAAVSGMPVIPCAVIPAWDDADADADADAGALQCLPERFPVNVLPIVRRLCDGPDAAGPPLILVASGGPRGEHLLDFVLDNFLKLNIIGGKILYWDDFGASGGASNNDTNTMKPDQEAKLVSAILHHVPVLLRTAAGVPHFLTHNPHLRLMVAHVPLIPAAWLPNTILLWAALQSVPPPTTASMFADPRWRPVPPGADTLDEDVGLLAEMLHAGKGLSVHLVPGDDFGDTAGDGDGDGSSARPSATLAAIGAVYAAYRRTRGYFRSSATEGGVTIAMLQAAAAIVCGEAARDSITAVKPSAHYPCVAVRGIAVAENTVDTAAAETLSVDGADTDADADMGSSSHFGAVPQPFAVTMAMGAL